METGAYQKVTKSYCQLTFIKWVPGIVKYYLKKISTCYQRVTKHSQSNSITVYRMVFARKNQAEHAWVVKGSLSVSTNGGTPRSLISRELFIINQLVCGTGTHPHCAMGVKLMHFLRNYFEFKYEPKKYHKPIQLPCRAQACVMSTTSTWPMPWPTCDCPIHLGWGMRWLPKPGRCLGPTSLWFHYCVVW